MPQQNNHVSKRNRKGKFIDNPISLVKKTGAGGLDDAVLDLAQKYLDNHSIDYLEIAASHLANITDILRSATSTDTVSSPDYSSIILVCTEDIMQIKAHSAYYHYDLLGDIAATALRFVENKEAFTKKDYTLLQEFRASMAMIIDKDIKGNGNIELQTVHNNLHIAVDILLTGKL